MEDTIELLTADDLCTRIKCTPRQLKALRAKGLPTIQVGTRFIRFRWAEVCEWLRDNENVSDAE